MISHITRVMNIHGGMYKVNFAISFDDAGVLDHLAAKAVISPSGIAHDCDGAIQVAVLSMTPVRNDQGV